MDLTFVPGTTVDRDPETSKKIARLIDTLGDLDDIHDLRTQARFGGA